MKYCGEHIVCIVTGAPGADLHHVKSRGSGGGDEHWNLLPVCHKIHNELHTIGLVDVSKKYPAIRFWLREKDWHFTGFKWVHLDKPLFNKHPDGE